MGFLTILSQLLHNQKYGQTSGCSAERIASISS